VSMGRRTIGILGAVALLAACGGDDDEGFADQPAQDIIAATQEDMKALSSLRMQGELTTDGDRLNIDMAVSTSGDCEGTLGQGDASAEIISVGGDSYMKPDAAFWELFAGADAAATLADQLDELDSDDDEEVEVEGTEEVGGQQAVRLASTSDDDEPVTVWVAVDEPHVILKMEVTEGDEPGAFTFSDFDEELAVEAPPADEVVDLDELG
jgi:hypothetical protein